MSYVKVQENLKESLVKIEDIINERNIMKELSDAASSVAIIIKHVGNTSIDGRKVCSDNIIGWSDWFFELSESAHNMGELLKKTSCSIVVLSKESN